MRIHPLIPLLVVIAIPLAMCDYAKELSVSFWLELQLRYRRVSKSTRSKRDARVDQRSPLLRLPLELRLQIYHLAIQRRDRYSKGGSRLLLPCIGSRRMHLVAYVPYPASWPPQQHIRTDAAPPSRKAAMLIGLGASARDPIKIPSGESGDIRYMRPYVFCIDRGVEFMDVWKHRDEPYCDITQLLRVCQTTYWDILPMLYSDNTMSLFGAEMVRYFARNIGQDGLEFVENVQLVLRLDPAKWMEPKSKRKVTEAIGYLMQHYVSLRQLDVEIVIAWTQPAEPENLWKWLMHDAFSKVRGLENFVLKIQVLKPFSGSHWVRRLSDQWIPPSEPLECVCDQDEYQSMRRAATIRNVA